MDDTTNILTKDQVSELRETFNYLVDEYNTHGHVVEILQLMSILEDLLEKLEKLPQVSHV